MRYPSHHSNSCTWESTFCPGRHSSRRSAPFWRVFEYTRSTLDRRRASDRSRLSRQAFSRTCGTFADRWPRYRPAATSAVVVGARDSKAGSRAPPRAEQDLESVVGIGSKPPQKCKQGDGGASARGIVRDEENRRRRRSHLGSSGPRAEDIARLTHRRSLFSDAIIALTGLRGATSSADLRCVQIRPLLP